MRLSHPQPDGATLRVHLQRAAKSAGRADPLLLRRAPAAGRQVWATFCELSALRPPGGPIPLGEVEAWQRLHGVRLTGWEVECITAMDAAARAVAEELQRKARPQ
ncbi:phage tail assembly chaperone [Pseudaquabacterium pictum]|uniref:Uncharacterized protein n=1 Tax=Pseudaquabacterium pictum TaxID=2315236 RepID=A0A480AI91_9BURK|nr:hypothetical protein [Rubrivivax pictus]GCL61489.1 hypothetical protein AQPW35_05700 [Rubrivivax pictus]